MVYLLLPVLAMVLFIIAYKAMKNEISRKNAIKIGIILVIFVGIIYYVLFS